MLASIGHAFWCLTRIAFSIEFWTAAPLSCSAEHQAKDDMDRYSLHVGPITLRFMCRFWPDDEGRP